MKNLSTKLKKYKENKGLKHISKDKRELIKYISLLIPFIYFIVINIVEPSGPISFTWHFGIWLPLSSYVVFWEGRKYFSIYKKMFNKIFDMNTLIGLASHILFMYSFVSIWMNYDSPMYSYTQMWEAPAILILITNIGALLENRIQSSSVEAYKKLEEMKNTSVFLIKDEEAIETSVKDIKIGDLIMIKKGGMVSLDGTLMSNSIFDLSNITGESKRIHIKRGEEIISGAYNVGEAVKIVVTRDYNNSTLSSIIDKIEESTMAKPELQNLADKILKWFVPSVMSISLLSGIIWLILGYTIEINLPWIKNTDPITLGITASVTVLAIACPCALGIATPLVYTVSTLLSSENGILVNNPKALEEIDKINIFAFDKTGTITTKEMEVSSISGEHKYTSVAKGLEENIDHPIASAINKLEAPIAKLTNIKTFEGGVSGIYGNQTATIKSIEGENSSTNIGLFLDEELVLKFQLKNHIKEGVIDVVRYLKQKGKRVVMITGDDAGIANTVAKQVGITEIFSNITSIEKPEIIKKLQKEGRVGFIGDGFNDSPSMKQANSSIAFASGSEITNSLSDFSILNTQFIMIKKIIELSRMNNKRVRAALLYAFFFNAITIPVAAMMFVAPWLGASVMAISDILVASNAIVYRYKGRKIFKKEII